MSGILQAGNEDHQRRVYETAAKLGAERLTALRVAAFLGLSLRPDEPKAINIT